MAAQNARVLQALEIQTLEASDDAVLGNADGVSSTSADNPVVVGSSSASSESDQAEESASSASHSAASSVDSDSESGDSVDRSGQHLKDAKALEALRTWSTKMKDANVAYDNDDEEEEDEELENKSARPAGASSSKKARKTSTAAESKSSSVKPTASKSTSSKSTAHKPAPSKPAAAKSAKSVSASTGQSAGNSVSSDLPDVLTLPLATLRTRAAQAVARDSLVPAKMKIWRNPPFFHLGSARCWDKILASCSVTIEMETVGGKSCVKPTPSSPEGLAAFLDVTSTQHPCQRLRSKLPDLVFFMSPSVLRRAKSR
ncbi:hypothetical protein PR002_g13086 [Phytophthora rubi]|uniref:Uncharacterized protein n=1 Tax=Phytophthora rubi TaxID=129364 RepID=A0A6A3LH88_9STRA|nr:hypothetical protein PR002_g13086 [Phytophthora rubi]